MFTLDEQNAALALLAASVDPAMLDGAALLIDAVEQDS